MATIDELETRLKTVEDRNTRVEADKAWETSLTRRGLLIIFTYLAVSLYFNFINIDRPWLNAVVPSLAFLLSTLTLPLFKNLWKKYIKKVS